MNVPKQSLCVIALGVIFLVGCGQQQTAQNFFDEGEKELDKKDWNGAIADFTHVIQLDPRDAGAYVNRGKAERMLMRYDNRGDIEIKKGDWNEAIADFSKNIELNPTNAIAYNNRGWAEFQKNNFDFAIADATHAIQLNLTNGYAYGTRGWAEYGKGDVVKSLEDCKKAAELFAPDSKQATYEQGLIDFINGDYEKAVAAWKKVIQQDGTLKRELQPWIEKAQAKLQSKTP